MIPALAGLIIFLLMMHYSHPPAQISEITSGEEVNIESRRFIEESGFSLDELQSYAVFRTNDELINQQIDHFGKRRFNDFIKNGFLRFIPSYYWQVLWIDTGDHEDISISLDSYKQPYGITVFRTLHAPDGALREFRIEDERGHARVRDLTLLRDSIDFDAVQIGNLDEEYTFHNSIKQAISGTVWDNHAMTVDSTYLSMLNDHQIDDNITQRELANLIEQQDRQVGNIQLTPQNEIFEHIPAVTVTLSSNGQLYEIDQNTSISGYESRNFEEPAGVVRIIFYTLAVLLLLIIFSRRLFQRLIDLRTATVYAMIAIGLVLLHMIHLMIQGSIFDFIEHQILQVFAILMGLILFSGFFGILIFIISGLGESLTREVWPDKITSLSLVRFGYLQSKRVGRSLVTGVPVALIYLGVASIMYSMSDHSYLNLLEDHFFYSDSYLLPPWQLFINSLFWMFLISIGLYACFISWIAINKNQTALLLFFGSLAFSLMSSFHLETPDSLLAFPIWFLPGLVVTYVFLKYDLLTLFISIFLFMAAWTTVDGLLVSGSPDALLAWSVYILMASLALAGLYLAKFGKDYEYIPELTPKYIREITREQRVERELEIAHQVHQSFLPVDLPTLEGLEIAADCRAAFDVGGDYYDVIPIDDQRMAFVIGDVSGKGIQAAFYMTMVKGIFQSLVKEIPDPVPLLTRMNRLFYANARRGSFISVCYGLIDVSDGTLRYARAGHNPGILFRARSNETIMLRSDGLALGLTNGAEFKESLAEQSIQLQPGDALIFYTDGFTEATNPRNEMFGDDRLLQEVNRSVSLPAGELINSLSSSIDHFAAGTTANDDMTMVVVKYRAH